METAARLDERRLRDCFSAHPSGVAAICALQNDETPTGMIVSTFVPVSLDPPLASICVRRRSATWTTLSRAPRLGVSILGAQQERQCRALAGRPADRRFSDMTWEATEGGAVHIADASATFECTIHGTVEAGDHIVVLLRLRDARHSRTGTALVFHRHRFRKLPDTDHTSTSHSIPSSRADRSTECHTARAG